jgi:UDP-N-acetylmuramyl pentapeptide phosphotransferase/UDP-N-acetylglucosamine-1-phosphate transferase
VAGVGWLFAGYAIENPLLVAAGAVIVAASPAFLFFNWPPASIVMGDVGSSFLVLFLAAVEPSTRRRNHLRSARPVCYFVWPFVLDTTLTIVRRAALAAVGVSVG